MKKRQKRYYPCDSFLALHQQLCWAAVAAFVLGGALLILQFAGGEESIYYVLAMACVVMALCRWILSAPDRILWQIKERSESEEESEWRSALEYLDRMEKALPIMKRKEMAYWLMMFRARLTFKLGQREEALALVRGFDKIWDSDQQEAIQRTIRQMEAAIAPTSEEEKEA